MASVACPTCGFRIESAAGGTVPTHCPSCGAPLVCGHCGKPLPCPSAAGAGTTCPACTASPGGGATLPSGAPPGVGAAASLPDMPGFTVLREIGRGGMGVVYAAVQHSLGRLVALKVLPAALASQPQFLKRFRNEAAVAGLVADAHLLPVFDVLESPAGPVLVLPLIEGTDLGRLLRDRQEARAGRPAPGAHPWAALDARAYLDRVLPLLDQVVDAVTAMHRVRVLHRNVEPSNVLLDKRGHAWLSGGGSCTVPGVVIGTAAFMSPEQARCEELDGRADVFSLAGLLYQALTLELPYGERGVLQTAGPPPPPSRHQPLLARDFDGILLRALARDRDERYGSAAEFREDWRLVRQGLPPRAARLGWARLGRTARRYRWQAAAVLFLALLLATLVSLGRGRLTGQPSAAQGAVPLVPVRTVGVRTDPPDARVVLVPLDPEDGRPRPEQAVRPRGRTPLRVENVPAGEYLVVAIRDSGDFQEVYRTVPGPEERGGGILQSPHRSWDPRPDGSVDWPVVEIPRAADVTDGMAYFPGGTFRMGEDGRHNASPAHDRSLPAFHLDPTEVTLRDWRQRGWTVPGEIARCPDDWPVRYLSFDAAVAYAEEIGKRLPDEAEYEFAATDGGKRPFPWRDAGRKLTEWPIGPVRQPAFDRLDTKPPVYGLYSNVAEWTMSRPFPYPGCAKAALEAHRSPAIRQAFDNTFVVRGGPWSVIHGAPLAAELTLGPRDRLGVQRTHGLPGLGFRCARSARARFIDP